MTTDHDVLVRQLEATKDIERLLFEHFHAVDEGDLDAQADMFARARVRYVQGDTLLLDVADRDAFLAAISAAKLYDDGTPRTHHVVSNVIVDVDVAGGRATSRCNSTVLQAADGVPLQPIACGVFDDEYRRDETGWYFAARVGRLRLAGDISNHVPTDSSIGEHLAPRG